MEQPLSAYRGDGPYVFVCYAHEDMDPVYREIAWLNDYGVNVWYDEGISPGHEWREELATAIQGCTRVLYFVTPSSVVSEHCRRELNFAQEENREVVAIHLEPTEVPAGLRLGLNNRQAIHKYDLSDEEYRKRLMRVTHEGARPPAQTADRPAPTSSNAPTSSKRSLGVAALVLVLLGAVGALWQFAGQNDSVGVTVSEPVTQLSAGASSQALHNSIAVLPFANLSPDPNDAYFAAGIHEEILNQLVKIKDLSVIARTTMLRYADSDKSIPEIGGELNVRAVMEGSVRYAGNRVRITAQLIDSDSGAHLWSEAYEAKLEDIFGVQLAIATEIADTLEAEFLPSEQERVSSQATTNPEAYAHYLRAVSSFGNFAPTGPMHEAIDAAIALDPYFAEALAFKAFLHAIEAIAGSAFVGPTFGAEDQRRFASLTEQYALRALAVDTEQARAHWALGWVQHLDRQWDSSQESFDRAYDANPNDYIALNGAAWGNLRRGDVDAGVKLMQRSVAVNPGDFANQGNFYRFLIMCERWQLAERQAGALATLFPQAAGPYRMLAEAASYAGDAEAAIANAAIAEARSDVPIPALAYMYYRIGDDANARRIFDAVESNTRSAVALDSFQKFELHLAAKEHDVALDHLEHAVEQNYPHLAVSHLHFHSHHPMFDPVREHPRFADLVRRVAIALDT